MTVLAALGSLLREDQLITGPEQLRTYECDGLTGRRVVPMAVALPESADEVAAVVRACAGTAAPILASIRTARVPST